MWHSHNHWSNEIAIKRYNDHIIVRFVTQKRQELKLRFNHPAIAIFNNFCGQTTADILSHLKSHNIVPLQLPANCKDKLQPSDILVKKPIKDYLKTDFSNGIYKKKKTA